MHIVRMSLGGVPPFTDPVVLKFDEQVNIFIGPNASGKSTILMMMDDYFNKPERNSKRPVTQGRIHRRLNVYTDDEFDEVANERLYGDYPTNVLAASEDWVGTRYDFITQENPLQSISARSGKDCQGCRIKKNLTHTVKRLPKHCPGLSAVRVHCAPLNYWEKKFGVLNAKVIYRGTRDSPW